MKQLLTILFALLITGAFSQVSGYIKPLKQGESYTPTFEREVVMNDFTFGSYYFYRVQYDSLKTEIEEYLDLVQVTDSLSIERAKCLHEEIGLQGQYIGELEQLNLRLSDNLNSTSKAYDQERHRSRVLEDQYNQKVRQFKVFGAVTISFVAVSLLMLSL